MKPKIDLFAPNPIVPPCLVLKMFLPSRGVISEERDITRGDTDCRPRPDPDTTRAIRPPRW